MFKQWFLFIIQKLCHVNTTRASSLSGSCQAATTQRGTLKNSMHFKLARNRPFASHGACIGSWLNFRWHSYFLKFSSFRSTAYRFRDYWETQLQRWKWMKISIPLFLHSVVGRVPYPHYVATRPAGGRWACPQSHYVAAQPVLGRWACPISPLRSDTPNARLLGVSRVSSTYLYSLVCSLFFSTNSALRKRQQTTKNYSSSTLHVNVRCQPLCPHRALSTFVVPQLPLFSTLVAKLLFWFNLLLIVKELLLRAFICYWDATFCPRQNGLALLASLNFSLINKQLNSIHSLHKCPPISYFNLGELLLPL